MPPVRTVDFILNEQESMDSTNTYFIPVTVLGTGYTALIALPVK